MKLKLAEAGIAYNDLKRVQEKGGAKAILAVLPLPNKFREICLKNAKPRITKNRRVLAKFVQHFCR